MIRFVVLGKPTTQGSHRPMVSSKGKGFLRPMMSEAMAEWRSRIAEAARSVMGAHSPLSCPVQVSVRFVMPRPKRPTNAWPRGDCDKLQRALGDAMTGIVYGDDAQICQWVACKVYGSPPGAEVEVREWPD